MNKPVAWIDDKGDLIPKEDLQWFKDEGYTHIPLYTHPLDKLDKVLKHNERLLNAMIDQRKFWEAEIEKKNTLLKMWETTNPVKELHLSLQKEKETGELLAVTYTDDEHRIVEVLWQRPPVKELTDEEIIELKNALNKCQYKIYPSKKEWECYLVLEKYAERLLRKAQEK